MKTPPGGWPLTIQVGIAVMVTIALSIWQINRGLDKLNEKHEFEQRISADPIDEESWRQTDFEHRKIQLRGQLDPQRWFIIENRRHQGRAGYWIVQVFNTNSDRYLVNRGWMSVEGLVHIDPNPETPAGTITITGFAWPNPILRTSSRLEAPNWPVRMREMEIGQMARLTSARAVEIRLIAGSAGVKTPAPLQREFATAMHWGYAAQWLLIGCLVLGGYWFFTVRKDKKGSKS